MGNGEVLEDIGFSPNEKFGYLWTLHNQLLRTARVASMTNIADFSRPFIRVLEGCLKTLRVLLTPRIDESYKENFAEIRKNQEKLSRFDKNQRDEYYELLMEDFAELVLLMDRNNFLLEDNIKIAFQSPKRS